MNIATRDLKESPLWIYRVYRYSDEPSGSSCDDLLKRWNFHRHIRNVIRNKEITNFFPVQEKVIPRLLSDTSRDRHSVFSSDVIITAPTGQGKTLCYVLPLLNNVLESRENRLAALVLVPSRELVRQIYEVFSWFVDPSPLTYDLQGRLLTIRVFYGDRSFIKLHKSLEYDPPHIAICTPAVFVEFFTNSDKFDSYRLFSNLKWIVVDEVDAMLNHTFYEWADAIAGLCTKIKTSTGCPPQKLLVSATVPVTSHEIQSLQLVRPLLFRLDEMIFKFPVNLTQNYIVASKRSRPLLLIKLIVHLHAKVDNILIFFSKISTCHRITRLLQIYIRHANLDAKAFEFTSMISHKKRNVVMNTYKQQNRVYLLCTDVVSRGIDLSRTSVVINYDFPKRFYTYIHRAGRTARGNKNGSIYVFLNDKETKLFMDHMKKMKVEINKIKRIEANALGSRGESEWAEEFKVVMGLCLEVACMESQGRQPYQADVESPVTGVSQGADPA